MGHKQCCQTITSSGTAGHNPSDTSSQHAHDLIITITSQRDKRHDVTISSLSNMDRMNEEEEHKRQRIKTPRNDGASWAQWREQNDAISESEQHPWLPHTHILYMLYINNHQFSKCLIISDNELKLMLERCERPYKNQKNRPSQAASPQVQTLLRTQATKWSTESSCSLYWFGFRLKVPVLPTYWHAHTHLIVMYVIHPESFGRALLLSAKPC